MSLTYAKRLAILAIVGGAAILIVIVRLYELQIVENTRWLGELDVRSNREHRIDGERGRILDADGALLAADGPGFDLMVVTAGWAGTLHRCRTCANEIYLRKQDVGRFKRCPRCKGLASMVLENRGKHCDLEPLAALLGTTDSALRAYLDGRVTLVEKRVEAELAVTYTRMSERRLNSLRNQLRRNYGWQPILFRRNVPYEVAREVTLNPERNPPFRIRETRTRRNFGGMPFAHLIGREPNAIVRAQSRAEGKDSRGEGKGLERALDAELRGEPGFVLKAPDPDRPGYLHILDRQAPVGGLDVRLTIATRDQVAAQSALGDAAGAFIVVNAQTGAVLAMVTGPTFDPDRYGEVVSEWVRLEIEAKEAGGYLTLPTPLLNRPVVGAYPPGSTMKPFTGLAGLTAGIISPDETIRCDRLYVLNGKTMSEMTCMEAHGPIALESALVRSCNIYFQTVVERLMKSGRKDHFESTARSLGFGEPTGLELEPGNIREWTLRLNPPRIRVPTGAQIQAGIGQGRVTATAAQVARAYAALATGRLSKLHLVASTGNSPTEIVRTRVAIPADQLESIRRALRAKTAHDSSLDHRVYAQHRVGTKTGTAQRGDEFNYIAWLAGFADAQFNRPAIAFAMVIEDSDEYGGARCGDPVAGFLADFYGADEQ